MWVWVLLCGHAAGSRHRSTLVHSSATACPHRGMVDPRHSVLSVAVVNGVPVRICIVCVRGRPRLFGCCLCSCVCGCERCNCEGPCCFGNSNHRTGRRMEPPHKGRNTSQGAGAARGTHYTMRGPWCEVTRGKSETGESDRLSPAPLGVRENAERERECVCVRRKRKHRGRPRRGGREGRGGRGKKHMMTGKDYFLYPWAAL